MSEGLPLPRRLYAILAVSFGTALIVIDGAIPTVALPTIARDLRVDSSAAVTIVTVYQLVLVMLLLPFSGLGSRIGLKRMFQFGLMVFTIATVLCFFARSLPFLLIVRMAQAVGAAACLSVSQALLRNIYPRKHLGRGLGFNTLIVSSAGALAPPLGGFVLALGPWPWVFASAVPFALLSLAFGRALPDPRLRRDPYDVLGALMCAGTFGLVIGGLESGVHGDSPVVSAAIVATGLLLGALMVNREKASPAPILPVDLLRRRVIALSIFGSFCAFVGSMCLLVSLSFRLQHEFGYSPAEAGAVLSLWPITMMVVAPVAGNLSDRIPAGLLGGIGMAIGTVALLLLAWPPEHASFFDFGWRMALCGLGFGLFSSPNARLIIGSAPPDRTASAGGLTSTTRLVGQTSGATLVAALLAMNIGGGAIPCAVSAGLAFVAGVCSVARLRPPRKLDKLEADEVRPVGPVR